MKFSSPIAIATLSIILFFSSNLIAQPKVIPSEEQQIIKMLRSFYTIYITENSKENSDEKMLQALKKNTCTNNLLHNIKGLDYDPFLSAQDCDNNYLKTLTIKKNPKGTNLFKISYMDGYSKKPLVIGLTVVKLKDGYKIDSIW
jgi:hypothetical protein